MHPLLLNEHNFLLHVRGGAVTTCTNGIIISHIHVEQLLLPVSGTYAIAKSTYVVCASRAPAGCRHGAAAGTATFRSSRQA